MFQATFINYKEDLMRRKTNIFSFIRSAWRRYHALPIFFISLWKTKGFNSAYRSTLSVIKFLRRKKTRTK